MPTPIDIEDQNERAGRDSAAGTPTTDDAEPQGHPRAGASRRRMGWRRGLRHRLHHGCGSKGRGHRRVDWNNTGQLEQYQRHLEQREADVRAKITRVRDRINELTSDS